MQRLDEYSEPEVMSVDEINRQRAHELFQVFDKNRKGAVKKKDIMKRFETSLEKCGLTVDYHILQDFIDRFLDGHNVLTPKQFEDVFCEFLAPDANHNRSSVSKLIRQNSKLDIPQDQTLERKKPEISVGDQFGVWFDNHLLRIVWLSIYLILNGVSFYLKYDEYCYRRPNAFELSGTGLCVARGCAQVCLLNSLLVLLPLCRGFMQTLRDTPSLREKIPCDDAILFHKVAGFNLVLSGMVHTVAQLYSFISKVMVAPRDVWEASDLAESGAFDGPKPTLSDLLMTVPGWTGVVLVLITLIATPFTLPSYRQKTFNYFWYSHRLFFPFYLGFMYFHGIQGWLEPSQAWVFLTFPILLFLIDRKSRVALYAKAGNVKILKVKLDKKSVALKFTKPKTFIFHNPGMYLYLNVPELSTFEWHPFTITAAPGDDFLSVNIRTVGDWTTALYQLLEKNESKPSKSGPRLRIDGPFGTPTQAYLDYKVVVMIGAGIGITPFASILRDMAYMLRDENCENCGSVNYDRYNPVTGTCQTLDRLYFHWLTRDQSSLNWFAESMNDVSELDAAGKIEIHNHLTSVSSKSGDAMIAKTAQKIMHDMTGEDIISGLATNTRTHFGRPDWDAVFHDMVKKHPGQNIGVFFCGPASFKKRLQVLCRQYSINRDRVKFDFFAEIF